MKTLTRVGFAVLLLGVVASLVQLGLALAGSRHAPSWLHSFVPTSVSMVGLVLATIGLSRTMRQYATSIHLQWWTDAAVPPDASADARRLLVPKPAPPVVLFAALMGLMMFTMFSMIAYPRARSYAALRDRGTETTGSVTGKSVRRGSVVSFYSIDYEFLDRLKTVTGHAEVEREEWWRLDKGTPIPVTFLESAPFISMPLRRAELTGTGALRQLFDGPFLLMLVLVAVLAVVSLLMQTMQKRMLHIVQTGSATIGTVTSVNGALVRYAFATPAGEVKGKFLYRSASIPRPAAGDRFVVVYDERRPSRNMAWPVARASFAADAAERAPVAPASTLPDYASLAGPAPSGVPARFRLSWQLPLMFFLAFGVLAAPLLNMAVSIRTMRRVHRLQTSGIETTGIVTLAETIAEQHQLDHLRLRYRYHVADHSYDGAYVEQAFLGSRRYAIGGVIPVTYAADDARVSVPLSKADLAKVAASRNGWGDIVIGGVVFVVMVALLGWTAWRTLVEWRFARSGRPAIAVVQEVKGSILRRCRYRFMTSQGDVEQTVRIQSKAFRPAVGERIEVLYLDHPVRSVAAADLVFVKRT